MVLNDDADLPQALEAYQEYVQALNMQASLVTEVRAWPLVLVLSWVVGGPLLVFGRREVSPFAGKEK